MKHPDKNIFITMTRASGSFHEWEIRFRYGSVDCYRIFKTSHMREASRKHLLKVIAERYPLTMKLDDYGEPYFEFYRCPFLDKLALS